MTDLDRYRKDRDAAEPFWFYGLEDPRERTQIPATFGAAHHPARIGLVACFAQGKTLKRSLYSRIEAFRRQAQNVTAINAGGGPCSQSNRWLADCLEHGITPTIQLLCSLRIAASSERHTVARIEAGHSFSGPNVTLATKDDEKVLGLAEAQVYLEVALRDTKTRWSETEGQGYVRRRYNPSYRLTVAALTTEIAEQAKVIAELKESQAKLNTDLEQIRQGCAEMWKRLPPIV